MIARINFFSLIVSSVLILLFYVKSVSPAALAKKIGDSAYQKCCKYRLVASLFMVVSSVNYVIYYFFPLPIALPRQFPWGWPLSGLIALLLTIPATYLMWRGIKDAGEETMRPKKEHTLYKGIYAKMRHPQAVGEVIFWWVIAFALNSPFLVIFSFLYLPIWFIMCVAEEKDLKIRYGTAYTEYLVSVGWFGVKN